MSDHTINMNAADMRSTPLNIGDGEPYTINLGGTTRLNENTTSGSPVTVNLAAHTTWIGGFSNASAPFFVHGAGEFDNHLSDVTGGNAVVDVHVNKNGTFNIGPDGFLEFTKLVGAGQNVNVFGQDDTSGTLQIDDPKDFHGLVNLGFGTVVLENLVADSYTFQNDLLTFYADDKVIDRLRLHLDNRAVNLTVSQAGGSINIHGDNNADGALLPLHGT